MRRVVLLVLLSATLAAIAIVSRRTGGPALAAPGIPAALAEDRAARITDLSYEASFEIPPRRDQPVLGRLTAAFTVADIDSDLILDFAQPADRLREVVANGVAAAFQTREGHVLVPAGSLRVGHNTVSLGLVAGDEALNRHDEFLYTLFVPARAHLTLPVFDQPDLKGRWTLSLTMPADWTALANGAERSRDVSADGRATITFAQTEPLPTYLVAFAAGRFQVETAERQGRTYRMFHRETDAAKVARNREAIFDLHASALAWLETYTAIPYAFGKFDFILIPSFQFGGMEHAGAVFYNASSLLLEETASQNQRLGRASLIAHETAHMWFGDLVTMRWFNDVWMKEVFANFMAAKIVNPSFPDVNHDLRFLFSHYPAAYEIDRTDGANPIRQPLANLNEAGSLYGAVIYQKAPIVMRQLERLMGEDVFRDGLRDYLSRHTMGNATWADLIGVLDPRTSADLAAWSRAWVEERGRPQILMEVTPESDGRTTVRLQSRDPRGRGLVWPQALRLILGSGASAAEVEASLGDTGMTAITVASGNLPDGPRWVLPTGAGLGYGDFVVPPEMLARLAEDLPHIIDPLTRGAALVTLWESMLEGRLPADRLRAALITAIPKEGDELNLSRQLGYLQTLYWRFTADHDRPAVARDLEPLLRRGLESDVGAGRRSVWFGAFRNTAISPEAIAWLERVWRREERIPELPLSENDEAELAADLALRGIDVLDAQAERIRNPDRRARFDFVRPALSSDPAVRAALFDRFKDVSNRRREPWVLEAMGYIHHPLRAAESAALVLPALSLVREIRDTGDIFFPKRWADATLGGHRAPDVAASVRTFINSLPPDYPERLRWVLLSSADSLFRAAAR